MSDELEFSSSYTLSKTFDDASDFDEQPQNPFDLEAENAISVSISSNALFSTRYGSCLSATKRTRVGSQKKILAGSRKSSATLKWHQF